MATFANAEDMTMLIIREILVRPEVVEAHFACNLQACKGACCWEGDWGAPLEREEMHTLERILPEVKPFLRPEGREVIEREGPFTFVPEVKNFGTPLVDGRACAYMIYDEAGIAKCGIEAAFCEGATDWPKPLSCHLYPIRVEKDRHTGMEMLRYDRWDICNPACDKGQKERIPLYQFVKQGLVRRYGIDWYEELDAAARYIRDSW